MNQNTEYAEYQDIRQNAPERGRTRLYGGVILSLVLLSGALILSLSVFPASAQVTTVTPYPAAIATATAAAQNMQQAQQAKADAARQAAQAQANANAADAQFNAAQQAANEARALLASQQIAAASEALGRAEQAIASGQARIGDLANVVDGMKGTIAQQADQISALTADKQQLTVSNQNLQAAYAAIQNTISAMKTKAAEDEARFVINPYVVMLGAAFLISMIVMVVMIWLNKRNGQHRDPPAAPPAEVIDAEYTDREDETP